MKNNSLTPKYATIVRLVNDQDGMYYLAQHPELDECYSDGETVEEALANLEEVTEMVLEHLREHNLPIPEPRPLFSAPEERGEKIRPVQDMNDDVPSIRVFPIPA